MPSPSYSTGLGALSKLSEIKGLHQPKKTLLVRGKQSFVACGAAKVIGRQFDQAELVSFSDFETNPKVEDALRGVELARANKIDLIIAVGGGSAMDMAKLIKAFYRDPTQAEAIATGVEASRDPAIP